MRTVVIGIGNEYRHDDAAGIAVVQRLRALAPPGVELADTDGEATALIELWSGADLAIVVDAVAGTAEPGHVYRLGLPQRAAASHGPSASHQASLGDAVALARALDRMPHRLVLFGIQVAHTGPGLGLSVAVGHAVGAVTAEITGILRRLPSAAR